MDTVDIKISEDLIKGIIETKVQAAITQALSSEASVVEQVVAAALECKVDEKGKRSRYDSDNKFTYLDSLCRKMIRNAAESAVQEWAHSQQKLLTDTFLKQLQTKKTANALVKTCVDGLSDAASQSWRFSVDVKD